MSSLRRNLVLAAVALLVALAGAELVLRAVLAPGNRRRGRIGR